MSNSDLLYRYLFEKHDVRGELVTLNETYGHILENHDYPVAVQRLLGEMLVATSLLTATLKFDGDITVQLQGDGPVKLAVINGNNQQQMRGVARLQAEVDDNATLKQMLGNGYLVITIMPKEGERYQGVVGLEGETVSECIEAYFRQSEQLPTRLFIKTGAHQGKAAAAGILLQVLPAHKGNDSEYEHLAMLTETIKAEELFSLNVEDILYRLYHEEDVTLFEGQKVSFHCTCSRERCAQALITISPEEIDALLTEEGHIDMHCDYCGSHYIFEKMDIESLRLNGGTNMESNNHH
ncbi:Hsp33 family molecular chaperone HslO [Pragia fontium]|uniref:33 kDa chaperonin n=2 Tax=Pragia fontium TaxID=82985 RepID=A0AAJ4WCN4_9GAMM|nr:Hsp33 family molecular chaperone HslO [Pragia fontium]GKX64568.1 33 kDa chaperonin [Pragia fontium]SFD24744.1 molecular chaperone Hsp33 [Pragia fontium DSM 5563 = ATCC 49100]